MVPLAIRVMVDFVSKKVREIFDIEKIKKERLE